MSGIDADESSSTPKSPVKVPGQEAMDQIMGAIDKMKQSLRDEIATQGAQLKKETEEL